MGAEILILGAVAIVALFTKGKVDSTAYANGKEPPGVTKARWRHERGGGARTASGRPKGPGAFRLMLASRWANACEAAKQRGDHKAARRRAWYEETAPLKDKKWREKKLARLEKADAARRRWAESKGLIDLSEYHARKAEDEAWAENARRNAEAPNVATDPATARKPAATTAPDFRKPAGAGNPPATNAPVVDKPSGPDPERAGEEDDGPTWEEIGRRTGRYHPPALPGEEELGQRTVRIDCPVDTPLPESLLPQSKELFDDYLKRLEADGWEYERPDPTNPHFIRVKPASSPADANKAEEPSATETPAQNTATEGSDTMYKAAVDRLNGLADQVNQYRRELAAFGDTLAGKGWGVEVTGPIQDMNSQLNTLEGTYRDLAVQMDSQGGQGAAAYDQAPWVPGPEAVLA